VLLHSTIKASDAILYLINYFQSRLADRRQRGPSVRQRLQRLPKDQVQLATTTALLPSLGVVVDLTVCGRACSYDKQVQAAQ
jgi:hypothetical protein